MLKTLIISLFGHAGLFIVPLAILYGLYYYARRTADVPWFLAFAASILTLGGMVLLQAQRLTDGIAGNVLMDPTFATYFIVLLFSTALTLNAKTVWKVNRERQAERNGQEGSTRRALRSSLARQAGNPNGVEEAIAEVDAHLDAREDLPRLIKKMLPTLGLLGTVIGLAMSMASLGGALSAAIGGGEGGSDELLMSMQGALSGMGGAFISTLFGAGFGMLLMVLLTRSRWMLTRLVIEAKHRLDNESSETILPPKPARTPKPRFRPDMN